MHITQKGTIVFQIVKSVLESRRVLKECKHISYTVDYLHDKWILTSRGSHLDLEIPYGHFEFYGANSADHDHPTSYMFIWVPDSAKYSCLPDLLVQTMHEPML